MAQRRAGLPSRQGALYRRLATGLRRELGEPSSAPKSQTKGTRDGRGIVFVGHDGEISPSGFLPLQLGNVRSDDLVQVYREHPAAAPDPRRRVRRPLRLVRVRDLCGGSRARAYAATRDPLASDPACVLAA